MLNPIEELKKYKKIYLDHTDEIEIDLSYSSIIKYISDEMGKLSRGQFRMSQKLEDFSQEIIDAIDSNTGRLDEISALVDEKDKTIELLNKEIKKELSEKNDLIKAFVAGLALFDTLVSFIRDSGDTTWVEQSQAAFRKALQFASEAGIAQTGVVGELFDDRLHDVVEVVCDERFGFREITGVDAKGYTYKGDVVKKARVTVNNERCENKADE